MTETQTVELAGPRAVWRWIRCKLTHTSAFEDREQWQDGALTRSRIVSRWCGDCGRPLGMRERRP